MQVMITTNATDALASFVELGNAARRVFPAARHLARAWDLAAEAMIRAHWENLPRHDRRVLTKRWALRNHRDRVAARKAHR